MDRIVDLLRVRLTVFIHPTVEAHDEDVLLPFVLGDARSGRGKRGIGMMDAVRRPREADGHGGDGADDGRRDDGGDDGEETAPITAHAMRGR